MCTQVPLHVLQANKYFKPLFNLLRINVAGGRMWPRQMANTLWALGKIGYDDVDLIDGVIKGIERVSCLLPGT